MKFGLSVPVQHPPVERASRVSRFEEALTLLKRLWTEDEVSCDGQHFRLDRAQMTLKPVQRPRPPIWIAASSNAGLQREAHLGDAWTIAGHATLATLKQQERRCCQRVADSYLALRPKRNLASTIL
jgi:alkanesulfonate monooxygenase SsuD/methylene tetrahydromethanopterin reductase-like flavin-dependent oxidoreductase (luciferase family)